MRVSDGVVANSPEARNVPPMRLVKAAHEFEAQLMKEMLKPLTTGEGFCGDGTDSGSGCVLQDFAGEALGQALSEHGGLGIAESIVRSISRLGNDSRIETVQGARSVPAPETFPDI
jgi:Rod binding domain-containing protein